MEKLVYNIVWADDDIDALLNDCTMEHLQDNGFKIVDYAHNGRELEQCLKKSKEIDAVIVDANFNETSDLVESESVTSGLDYARHLYVQLDRSIPFFLYTARADGLLEEVYKYHKDILKDFPRHKRWFHKTDEFDDMLDSIKNEIDKMKSSNFIVRNRYRDELNASIPIEGAYEYIFEFLVRDYENNLGGMSEPFIRIRRIIEKLFGCCENLQLIPPISNDVNGTARYFLSGKYDARIDNTSQEMDKISYKCNEEIMPKVLAKALNYLLNITQDASHSKVQLSLKVDEYYKKTNDVLFLKSLTFILMDIVKWFSLTALSRKDPEVNGTFLWEPVISENEKS
jgi:hypothetical protein